MLAGFSFRLKETWRNGEGTIILCLNGATSVDASLSFTLRSCNELVLILYALKRLTTVKLSNDTELWT